MLAGSVRVTLVPASSAASTVPTATSIALTPIGAGIVTALTARRAAIPLTPARSPRTGSVPGPYRRPSSTESFLFRPEFGGGCHRCNRQRHAVEPYSSSLGSSLGPNANFLLVRSRQFIATMPLSNCDRLRRRRSVPGGASGLQNRQRAFAVVPASATKAHSIGPFSP